MRWFDRVSTAIQHEYERRIRRASQLPEGDIQIDEHQEEEDGDVEIANLPPGIAVQPAIAPEQPQPHPSPVAELQLPEPVPAPVTPAQPGPSNTDAEDDEGAEITNLPR